MKTSRSLAVAAAFVVAAGALGACFGPTEITVGVTTNARCDKGIQTQIFTAPRGTKDFGAAPAADTRQCGPDVGTLSIVPSGARDDQFDVQVVAGVGVDASSCRSENVANCIVARRRVSFRPHKSLRVPVFLSDRCIGVPCDSETTCDLGTCTPSTDCTELGCPRERGDLSVDTDGGTDASADAVVDAPDGMPACESTPTVVAENQAAEGQLFMQGGYLVYGNFDPAGGPEIRRVPARGGPAKPPRSVPGLIALAANDTETAFMQLVPSLLIHREPVGGTAMTTGYGNEPSEAIGISGPAVVGVTLAAPGGSATPAYYSFAFDNGGRPLGAPALPGSMLEVAVDEDGDWYGVAGGATLYHFKPGSPDVVGALGNRQPNPDIGVANRTLFVALGGALAGIHMIPSAKVTDAYHDPPILAGVVPRSITAHKSFLYYIEGTSLQRVDVTTLKTPVRVTTVASDATSLIADEACVYWIENGGKRIMRHRAF